MVCNPAPMVPTIERDRTTIPRTTPRFRLIRNPGSSNAVVTYSCGTMPASYTPVDLDDRRILADDGLLQPISDFVPAGAVHATLRLIAAHDQSPLLPQE